MQVLEARSNQDLSYFKLASLLSVSYKPRMPKVGILSFLCQSETQEVHHTLLFHQGQFLQIDEIKGALSPPLLIEFQLFYEYMLLGKDKLHRKEITHLYLL